MPDDDLPAPGPHHHRVRGSLAAAVGLAVSVGALVWAGVGALSEAEEPYKPDYLWRAPASLTDRAGLIAAVAGIGSVVSGFVLVRARRAGALPGPRIAQVAIGTGLCAWLGLGYRMVTAATTGANIGGGLVLLATPVLAVATTAAIGGLELVLRRRPR